MESFDVTKGPTDSSESWDSTEVGSSLELIVPSEELRDSRKNHPKEQ